MCGFRFRIHQRELPGTPDIVLKKYFTTIFVHGCFWHQHHGCKYAYKPKSHTAYWNPKLKKNIERDRANKRGLRQLGWRVITVWECELSDLNALAKRLIRDITSESVNKQKIKRRFAEKKQLMDYPTLSSERLRPKANGRPVVLDLFAGCGGLALGFEAQGFETIGYEMDATCCETYNKNLSGKCITATLTPDTDLPKASVVIGGPPCQPFSVIGKQNGLSDSRDGFPIFISAIKKLDPDIWLFENVRGLLYRSKSYFESILKELKRCNYVIEFQLLNAVNYGVPQNRERLIVVGHRGEFFFPKPAKRKITAGEAISELAGTAPPEARFLTKSMDEYIARYERASQCVNLEIST